MSDVTRLRTPDGDEPAVTQAGLMEFVEAARRQPVATPKVDADTIHRGWAQARSRRRTLWGGLAVAAAVALAFASWGSSLLDGEAPTDRSVAPIAKNETAPPPIEPAPPRVEPAPPSVTLAAAVRLDVVDGVADHDVLAPWAVAIRGGHYRIAVDETADAPDSTGLSIALPGPDLELRHGVVVLVIAGDHVDATLESGEATWVADDGTRTALSSKTITASVERPTEPPTEPAPETAPPKVRPKTTATELAAKAEARLAAGDRDGAIELLQLLVRRHRRAAATRAALLDLGRLLKAAGRHGEARCAYRVYLERWPTARLRGEVEQALERLGEGPACRGLRPVR